MYTGIAYRDQNRTPLQCQKTLPLADISNRNVGFYFKASSDFSLFQDNFCQSDLINFWNTKELTTTIMLSKITNYSLDGFPVLKTVEISKDLSYKLKVGNVVCPVADLNLKEMMPSITHLMSVVSSFTALELCLGCKNPEYAMLGTEINSEEQLLGKARFVGVLGGTGGGVHYFSSNCKGILKAGTVGKLCGSCLDFDAVLRCRLYRARSTRENVKDPTRVNIRYMNSTNVQHVLDEEQSKRRNAERREKYAKRRLKAEKELKPIAEDDHRDLSKMFGDVEKDKETFADKPDIAFFWSVQKEMLEKNSRKWHPRFVLFFNILLTHRAP